MADQAPTVTRADREAAARIDGDMTAPKPTDEAEREHCMHAVRELPWLDTQDVSGVDWADVVTMLLRERAAVRAECAERLAVRDAETLALQTQLLTANATVQAIRETPWVWAGDGTDDLDSMAYGAGITILAGQLSELLRASAAKDAELIETLRRAIAEIVEPGMDGAFQAMSDERNRFCADVAELRAEVAELRKRDPERLCGMCGHQWQHHDWHRALGCCVASASDSYCDCLGFTEPAAGRESGT